MFRPRFSLLLGLGVVSAALLAPAKSVDSATDFKAHVKPILVKNCYGCHSTDYADGGLDLSTTAGLKKGGTSGRLYVARKSAQSLIVKRLKGQGGTRMPKGEPPLSNRQIQVVKRWIDEGAKL